jgi:hypothetical protein
VRVPPLAKIALGITVMVLAGVTVKALVSPGPPSPCVFSCSSPPVGVPQPDGVTYSSPSNGFSFTYPAGAQTIAANGAVTVLNYKDGGGSFSAQLIVNAGTGAESPASLVTGAASRLATSEISNLQSIGPILGAEIGFAPGEGEFFRGQYLDSLGYQYPVQIGIVAVQRGSHWVDVVGISAVGASSNTPLFFGVFDDILDRWRWTR